MPLAPYNFSVLCLSPDQSMAARVAFKIESGKALMQREFKIVEKKVENLSGRECCRFFGDALFVAATEFDLDDFDEAGE